MYEYAQTPMDGRGYRETIKFANMQASKQEKMLLCYYDTLVFDEENEWLVMLMAVSWLTK